jgi:phosphate transport system substrate-binding protein
VATDGIKTDKSIFTGEGDMKRFSIMFTLLMILAIIAAACAPAAAPATPQVVEKQVPVEVTKIVAGTPEVVVVTATPDASKPALPAGSVQITGAGATFPDPVYTEWRFAYPYVDPSVVINYQAIGSGGGKKAIVDGTVDFAGSDSLLTTEYTTTTKGQLQMFPTLAGAIVPIFNLAPEVTTTLTLDGPTMVGIYLGKITKWSDPAIKALNPDANLPDKPITVVHRSDGSGTTEAFTKYLAAVSDDWKNGPGAGQSVQWPVDKAGNGVGGKGNAGVAAAVQNTPYSIGYVELSYATANKIAFAKMVNAAGKTVTANAESLQSAMADFGDKFSDKLTIDRISNGPGDKTWPISTYTYQVLYMDQKSDPQLGCAKVEKYLDWVHWFLTDSGAAKRATDLGYAVLPDGVRAKVFDKLAQVTCDGKPVNSDITLK